MKKYEKLAGDIQTDIAEIYVEKHQYGRVESSDFRHLDLKFYDSVRAKALSSGFVSLGDYEDLTLKGTSSDMRTFLRFLVSSDGRTSFALYHPKPKLVTRFVLWIIRAKIGKTTDCETEFSDGRFLVTSNAEMAGLIELPPQLEACYLPEGTESFSVYEKHQERVDSYLSSNSEVSAVKLSCVEDVFDMQHRMELLKSIHRKDVGFMSEKELMNLGATDAQAKEIRKELER